MACLPRGFEPLDLLLCIAQWSSFFPVKLLSGKPHKLSLQSHRAADTTAPLMPPAGIKVVAGKGGGRQVPCCCLQISCCITSLLQTTSIPTSVLTHGEQNHCWLHFPFQLKSSTTQFLHPSGHFSQGSIGTTLFWGAEQWAEDFGQWKDGGHGRKSRRCFPPALRPAAPSKPPAHSFGWQHVSPLVETGLIPYVALHQQRQGFSYCMS